MAMQASDIADIAATTYDHLPKLRFQQIAQELQDYEVLPKVFKRAQSISGESIKKILMTSHGSNAKHVGLYNTDITAVADVTSTIDTPWRHAVTSWAFDSREVSMNQAGPWQIVELMKLRRADALLSQAKLLEEAFFKSPSASTDTTEPHGVPYWIVTSASKGFEGGTPSGHSSVGGLSHSNFKNYTDTYSAFTKSDLIDSMREAFLKVGWKSPVTVRDYRRGLGQRHRYYTDVTTRLNMEILGEDQNMNLGRDLASMDGNIVFRGIPIVWVPRMDTEFSDNRIYMIDFDYFICYFLKGRSLLESKPMPSASSHNGIESYIDTTYNYQCFDRRRQAVIYKV